MPPVILRCFLALLLLAGLAGCSVYDRIFHPYRLPTPPPSPEFIKQQKAKDLKAKKGSKADKKAKGEAAVEEAPAEAAPDAGSTDEKPKPPEKFKKVKYDGQGLVKKPKLERRRYHKPPGKGFHPIDGIKNFFKYKLHGKPKQKPSGKGKDKSGAEPAAPTGGDFPSDTGK